MLRQVDDLDDAPVPMGDQKLAHAKRILASFLVLEVEGTRAQSQLADDLAKHALVKVKGDESSGNIMIIFDVNGFARQSRHRASAIRRSPKGCCANSTRG